MSDKELLEMAARAAGLGPVLCYETRRNCLRLGSREKYSLWNPIIDDGDEVRLEASLQLHVTWMPGIGIVRVGTAESWAEEPYGKSRQVARRRAGVRAAAEIGKAKP